MRKAGFEVALSRLDRASISKLLNDGEFTLDSPSDCWQLGVLLFATD